MSKLDFQAVYLACWRSVYRYAYALTRNRHEAEDLAQEAFVRFLHTKESFRGECRDRPVPESEGENLRRADRTEWRFTYAFRRVAGGARHRPGRISTDIEVPS